MVLKAVHLQFECTRFLGILLKGAFWFNWSGVGLRVCMSNQFPWWWSCCRWEDHTMQSSLTSETSLGQYCGCPVAVVVDSPWPHGLQHARLPSPSPSPRVYSDPCPSSRWCRPTVSTSVVPFSSCPPSFPAAGSFPMSQLFSLGGQNIGASASASVLPMNIQGWFPLGWTGLISLLFKGLSKIFSNTAVRKHQFFSTLPSLWSNSHII